MNAIDKKYQIFISSTYIDLIKARGEVIKVILNMYHIPIGMEMFSADNAEQWDTIQDTINSSDYYILIIGHRYGSQTKDGIGYTEKEFDFAKEMNVPIYAYIRNRNIPTSPDERETTQDSIDKLERFIEKVKTNSMVEFWDNPSDLGQKISIAMPKAFRKTPRIGWVRSNLAASPETLNELATLSKGNRELKAENEKLKLNTNKKPILKLTFNNEETIKFDLPSVFHTSKTLTRASRNVPNNLNPGAHIFYNGDTVNLFNDWFDENPDIVEEYNNSVTSNERLRANIKSVEIGLINIGSVKANDINITVTFPPNVLVLDEISKLSLPEIKYPEGAPEPPTKIALDAFKRSERSNINSYGYDPHKHMVKISTNMSIEHKKNTIKIWVKDLLHTKECKIISDLVTYLMPLKEDELTAKVEIICEEFSESYEYEIPVIIASIE